MLKRINRFLFNSPEGIGLDNYLVLIICFVISVVALLGTFINLFLHLGILLVISTIIPGIVFAAIFLYSRIKKRYILSKYILVILSLIMINVQWQLNFGTYGPILYLFVVIQSFIVLLFKKWERVFFTLLILLNITVLFFIEFEYPDIFGRYSENKARLIDLYWGMLIYLALCIILIDIAVAFYIRQKEKAQHADLLKTSFLANMSHEIRTPMNSIIGFGQLLNETDINEKQREYLKIMEENSFHLLKLIDDIIDISKIEANQVKIIYEEFSVNELLDGVYHIIQKYLESNNKQHLQLICNNPPDNFTIISDYTRIKQVLTNLLSNAVKFTEQGSIVFGYTKDSDGITFYVHDTGIGINKKYMGDIFQRFGKIENPSNEKIFRGTGLGLSISKQLIELMNGRIWVESEFGKGARFSFTIPAEISSSNDKTPFNVKIKPGLKFSGEIILIAEDDDNSYSVLAENLDKYGIVTIRANNGFEAIELCKTVPGIRLILMDIRMPKMDGYEATKKIKEILPDLPIIAQTAFAMKSDKMELINAGCDDYISKPIDISLLMQKINSFF